MAAGQCHRHDAAIVVRHSCIVKRIRSMWPSPVPQPGYVVECSVCGRVGAPCLHKDDAKALAEAHSA